MSANHDLHLHKEHKCHDGFVRYYSHLSHATSTTMRFAAYLPPQIKDGPVPVIYWLSGLTCTEENFITKAHAPAHAARYGVIVIAPDTSPRGANIPGEDDAYDLGTGASFYVNALQNPWSQHYKMYDYVVDELPRIVEKNLPVATNKRAIMGHSMGGHGALVIALRNAERYSSVSAFAPVCAPSETPWGQKVFSAYLGISAEARAIWKSYDASALIRANAMSRRLPILVDQGQDDEFLEQGRLRPDLLKAASAAVDYPLTLRYQAGYDHSYYFIQTFIGEHFAYHAAALSAPERPIST